MTLPLTACTRGSSSSENFFRHSILLSPRARRLVVALLTSTQTVIPPPRIFVPRPRSFLKKKLGSGRLSSRTTHRRNRHFLPPRLSRSLRCGSRQQLLSSCLITRPKFAPLSRKK